MDGKTPGPLIPWFGGRKSLRRPGQQQGDGPDQREAEEEFCGREVAPGFGVCVFLGSERTPWF